MKKVLFLVSIFIISHISYAQHQVEIGARQGGTAGSGVVLTDIWSSYHNQAGLSDINGLSVGLFYSNLYNVNAFRQTAFAFAIPTEKYGSAGLNYSYSGDEYSNFSKFGLAYAKRLGKRFTAGIQLDYFRRAQLNYGITGIAVGEFGMIAEPIKNLFIGAHVFNPWRAKFYGTDETLTSIFRLGAGYKFSEKVLFTLEGEKDIEQKAVVRCGTEYNVAGGLFLRAGVATNPVKYSFGLGYNYKDVVFDLAFINHNVLGYYMQFGLGYTLNKNIE
ncbi:MAG: hypothetical protein L3J35_12645 [Bacteroidales bacterium]|nr:hypothetical protein [Bacteroidales bacterium]